jgi:DNA-binding MarR family transcriptional regulator
MERSDFLDLDCLAYATRRTGRAVTNVFNARMAPLDLNVAQFGLLAAVAKMPGATLAAIGEAMLLDESTMARNFALMERRGLVQAEGGRGRSGKQARLTRTGAKLYAKAAVIWRSTNQLLTARLDADAVAAGRKFLRALGEVSEKVRAEMDSPPVAPVRKTSPARPSLARKKAPADA